MVLRERLGAVTNVHRMALRKIPSPELGKPCRDLALGPEAFRDVLQLALEGAVETWTFWACGGRRQSVRLGSSGLRIRVGG